jgi:chromatin remodeling complex protein RSC6
MANKEAKTKATKTPKAPKSVDTPAPVPVPPKTEPVVPKVEEPATVPVEVVVEAISLAALFTDLNKTVHDLTSQLSLVKSQMKQLEKHVGREMRVLDKFNARKNKNKGNRAPSGFVKPTKISEELAAFLGKEPGTLMARTDVTKQITAYIRSNSLQDKANGRLILADEKLKKLLNYDEKAITDPAQHLSYFNLQRYLSGHFEKTVV